MATSADLPGALAASNRLTADVTSDGRITRRRLAAGAAWSVPVMALAATTPAVAVSLCPPASCFSLSGGSLANGTGITSGSTSFGGSLNLGNLTTTCTPSGSTSYSVSFSNVQIGWVKRSDSTVTYVAFGGTVGSNGTATWGSTAALSGGSSGPISVPGYPTEWKTGYNNMAVVGGDSPYYIGYIRFTMTVTATIGGVAVTCSYPNQTMDVRGSSAANSLTRTGSTAAVVISMSFPAYTFA